MKDQSGRRSSQHRYILSGQVEITIDGETEQLGPGDAYYIPSQVQHGFNVLTEDALEYLEIFSPPKEENITMNL